MKRVIRMAGVLVMLVGLAVATRPADAEADGVLTNKEIMVKLNKGPKSLCPVLGKELKDAAPKWAEIQKQTKEFAALAEAMAKNSASKGPAASWEKLTKSYAADAKELDEAAQKKDKTAALAAHAKLAKSCKACHTQHKPKK